MWKKSKDSSKSINVERKSLLFETGKEPYRDMETGGKYDEIPKSLAQSPGNKNKLGTFMGVIVTCILNTFGVVIFERLGWVTGQAGVLGALMMYGISYILVFITVLSVAAIATNGQMKGGGTYYLVSRALGTEFGGSIGIIFYIANAFGAAFYLIGFGEALQATFDLPSGRWWIFLYCSIALFIITLVCLVGASFYARTSLVILIALTISIILTAISMVVRSPMPDIGYTGLSWETLKSNMQSHYSVTEGEMYDFRKIFSIMFPSVTGLIAGSNMSGDLQDPAKSIPIGTIISAVSTVGIYGGLVVLLGATCTTHALLTDYFIMLNVAYYGRYIVSAGIFCAVLSSALAAIIGGARVIQAIAKDDLLPFLGPFKKGSKKGDEPRLGVLLTAAICQAILIVSSINVLAPFITMFFLLSFLSTNFACFFLRVTGAPNFRPSFKYFHWSTALLGALLSLAAMFYVDPIKAAISIALLIILFFYIHFRAPPNQWGDISQALIYHQVRKYLLRLDSRKEHVKFWRPQMLYLCANPRSSVKLIHFINNLKKGGLYVLGHVVIGDWEQCVLDVMDRQQLLLDYVSTSKLKTFIEVTIATSVRQGVQSLLLSAGLGGMKPNTLIMGWLDKSVPKDSEELPEVLLKFPAARDSFQSSLSVREYVSMIKDALTLKKNVIIAKGAEKLEERPIDKKFIDMWILGETSTLDPSPTLSTMLLHGSILRNTKFCTRNDKLRVLSIVKERGQAETEEKNLKELLMRYRIQAEVQVFVEEGNTFHDIMIEHSENTKLVFVPLPFPPLAELHYDQYYQELDSLTDGLPPTLLMCGTTFVLTNEL